MKEQIGIFYSFLCFYLTDDDSRPIVIIERTRAMIRISGITLRNFKNVKYGTVTMPSFLKKDVTCADILGIYGQNGSGKSAAIEARGLMQRIMTGEELPGKSYDYINIDSDSAALSLSFSIEDDNGNRICIIRYEFEIRNDMGSAAIASESLYRKDTGKRSD